MFVKGYKPSDETRAKIAAKIDSNREVREKMEQGNGDGRRHEETPRFTFRAMPFLQEVVRDLDEKIKVLQLARQKILEAEIDVRGVHASTSHRHSSQ